MPIDYKSLAQLQPSPAKAPEIFNLIKNPSFDRASLEPWRMSPNNRSFFCDMRFRYSDEYQTSAITDPGLYPTTWGSPRCGYFTSTDSGAPALWTGWSPWRSINQTQVCPYPEDLVPAKPNKQYYMAFSLSRQSSNTASNYRLRVWSWDADYKYVASNDLDFSGDLTFSGVTSKWQRVFTTFTSDPATQYFSFAFYKTSADNIYHIFTDLYVGEFREYAEAPFNSQAQDLTTVYPFDRRRFGYLGDLGNSYTGQSWAGPLELLYTVPASKSALISSIIINNVGKTLSPYRIAILPSTKNISNIAMEDFICFDDIIKPRESYTKAQGITLSAGDKIYVSADTGQVNFNMFGSEII